MPASDTTTAFTPPATPRARRRRGTSRLPRIRGWGKSADAVRISLFAITLVSISAIHMYLGPLRAMRPSLLFLGLATLAALMNPRAMRWSNLKDAWPAKAVILLFVIAVGSAFFGLSLGGSAFYILDRYSKVLLVFFLTVAAIRDARDLSLLMWSYVIAIGLLLILAMTVLELEPTSSGLGRMEGGQSMFDANDLGMIFLMAIPLGLLLFFNSGRLGRIIAGIVVIGSPAAIALTGSRGAMVGLVALAPVLFFTLGRVSVVKRLSLGVAIVGALVLAAPAGYWKQMQTIFAPTEDYNLSSEYGRVGIAKRGVGYMLRYPLFGVGINNFPRAEGEISPIAQRRLAEGEAVEWIAAHNTYVQVGAELGVIGLTTWLALLYGGTIGLWRLRRKLPKSWDTDTAERRFLREACLFLPGSFIAFALTSYFLSHTYTPPAYIFFAFLAGVLVLVRRELRADRAARRRAITAVATIAADGPFAPPLR